MVRAGERRIKCSNSGTKKETEQGQVFRNTETNFHNKREKKQPSSKFLDNVFLKVLLIIYFFVIISINKNIFQNILNMLNIVFFSI